MGRLNAVLRHSFRGWFRATSRRCWAAICLVRGQTDEHSLRFRREAFASQLVRLEALLGSRLGVAVLAVATWTHCVHHRASRGHLSPPPNNPSFLRPSQLRLHSHLCCPSNARLQYHSRQPSTGSLVAVAVVRAKTPISSCGGTGTS